MSRSKHLVVRSWLECWQRSKRIAFKTRCSAYGFANVEQRGNHRHQLLVEVCKEFPLLFIEGGKVIGIIFKERRLPITALQSNPVLMSPVAMVADTNVTHRRLCPCLHNRYSESKRPIRAVNETPIAKGLLHKVLANLKPYVFCTIICAVMRYRCKIAARQQHGQKNTTLCCRPKRTDDSSGYDGRSTKNGLYPC